MCGRRLAAAQTLDDPPGRNDRPDELEDEEAPLRLPPRVDREDGRADEVRPQLGVGAVVEHPELRQREGGEDEQRAGDLHDLVHGAQA